MAESHSTMFDILVKVGLGEHYGVFLEQKITPDIVCCLAAIEIDSNFAILETAKPSIKFSKTSFGIITLGGPHSL
jgi:hypothetical protein